MRRVTAIKQYIISLVLLFLVFSNKLWADDTQTVAVFGASGRIGSVVVIEALERGHRVLGVSRKPEKLSVKHHNFIATQGDLDNLESLRRILSQVNTVVISVSARAKDNKPENSMLVSFTENIIKLVSQMENKPYIMQVGGANLMYGTTYEEVKKNMGEAQFNYEKGSSMHAVLFGHQLSVDMYRASNLSWTVIAPPMRILGIYGELDSTTSKGAFRTSNSEALVAKDGSKSIYVRDLARAVVNEIESRQYRGQVFTVGY